MNETTFTPDQIRKYRRYEKVRKSGRYNMLFPQARMATGLSEEDYSFIIKNFSELRKQAGDDQ